MQKKLKAIGDSIQINFIARERERESKYKKISQYENFITGKKRLEYSSVIPSADRPTYTQPISRFSETRGTSLHHPSPAEKAVERRRMGKCARVIASSPVAGCLRIPGILARATRHALPKRFSHITRRSESIEFRRTAKIPESPPPSRI